MWRSSMDFRAAVVISPKDFFVFIRISSVFFTAEFFKSFTSVSILSITHSIACRPCNRTRKYHWHWEARMCKGYIRGLGREKGTKIPIKFFWWTNINDGDFQITQPRSNFLTPIPQKWLTTEERTLVHEYSKLIIDTKAYEHILQTLLDQNKTKIKLKSWHLEIRSSINMGFKKS